MMERRELLRNIFKNGVALLSITRGGVKIISSIAKNIDFVDKVSVFVPKRFASDVEGATSFENVKELISDIFDKYDGIIAVISLGALIRLIASKLKSKDQDPAVLCIDEAGKFVISVISGHVGGANELCREIAKILNATPVITTASDSIGTIPVDILGREFGWKITADHDTLVKVSSSVVNHDKVAIVQESGEKIFYPQENFSYFSNLEEFLQNQNEFKACLFISHRFVSKDIFKVPTVFYNPRVLHVGIGFDKGVESKEIYDFLVGIFDSHRLSLKSIKTISTVDVKKEDEEFRKFSDMARNILGVDVFFVEKHKLSSIEVKNPSEQARKYLGIPSVSEACALFCAKNGKLLVEKQKTRSKNGSGITLAVAIESE